MRVPVGDARAVAASAATMAGRAAAPRTTSRRDGDGEIATGSVAALVADGAALLPGQVGQRAFFDGLEARLHAMCDRELAAVGRSAAGCPYLAAWLTYYRAQSPAHVERAIRRYAGTRTTSADGLADAVVARVRAAVRIWTATGEVTGIPDEPDAAVSPELTVQRVAAPGAGGLAADPVAVRGRLGVGAALEPATRARLERGLGHSFAHVRVHHDAGAAALASALSARAFTVGSDIAFADGQYRPGTLTGDVLIAHELAHTIQQSSPTPVAGSIADRTLERDADRAAASAIAGAWGGTDLAARLGLGEGRPTARTGLRLQGCTGDPELAAAAVGVVPDYKALELKPGEAVNTTKRADAWMAMMRNPDQLDRVQADAVRGDPSGVAVWAQLEQMWSAIGTEIATKTFAFECTLPAYRELSGQCIPDWTYIDRILSKTQPAGVRLRELTAISYSQKSRSLGIRNQIIGHGLNLLMAGWAARSALAGEARALGEAPPALTGKPPVVEPPPAVKPPVAAVEPPLASPTTTRAPVTAVATPALVSESQAALSRASSAKAALPRDMADKAVASDGAKTVSGWRPAPSGFGKATPEQVADYSKSIGHTPTPAGGLDQVNRGGFPGKYHSSHAEKQLAVVKPNHPIAVTEPMCADCRGFFQKQAAATKRPQVVTDPDGTRVFHPDGRIDFTPKVK